MIKLVNLLKEAEEEMKCPVATQDITVNLEHRQKAIDEYGYGPLNPNNPNIKFWKKKMEEWNLDSMEEAKSSRCNNCAAFNITTKMLNCIEKGIVSGEKEVTVEPTVSEAEEGAPIEEPETDDTEGAEKPLIKPLLEAKILAGLQKQTTSRADIATVQRELAKDLAAAIDEYIKSATIIIPPGQASSGTSAPGQFVAGASPSGPVTAATVAPGIVTAVTSAPSPNAIIT